MPYYLADPLRDGCPWSGFTPPTIDWCEEELCAAVVNPAGAWSNLAYVAFGVLMWRRAARLDDPRLALFGPASIAVGVASFAYHASYTYLLQFFDFVGMFLFCFTVITANAVRLGWIAPAGSRRFFLIGVAGASALVLPVAETPFPIQGLVALLIAAMLGQELASWRRSRAGSIDYRPYVAALVLFALATAASAADATRAWCDPRDPWLQGHAVWHVLTAASLYLLFGFYAQQSRSA